MGLKRRKRHKKKLQKTKIIQFPISKDKEVLFSTHKITYDPIPEEYFKELPENTKQKYYQSYNLISADIKTSISILENLVEKYPAIPEFNNNLAAAYSIVRKSQKAKLLIEKNYKINPDYLFAKTSYAELLLHRREFDKIPGIFSNKFDLKLLYPNRDVFHITEVVSFYGVLGLYYYKIGKTDQAIDCYKLIKEYGPEYAMTKRLGKILLDNSNN